ncbi:hypothetical protein M513_03889, partial [Trichuris suis]
MKLLLLFLFSLTTILSESFPQNKMVREKRQSTFLEGLGGPLALKPHAGKNDTINRTASTAEAMPSQTTTKTVPITTKTTTTRMTTTAPIRTTEATKIKELKAKPKLASTTSAKTATTVATAVRTSSSKPTTTVRAPMSTLSAKARIQVPKPTTSGRPADTHAKIKPTTAVTKQESTRTTYSGPSPCCQSCDLMRTLLFGRCACVTTSNCQPKQRTIEQRPCENLNNANMDKLKREIFQEFSKQLDSLKKDIMS